MAAVAVVEMEAKIKIHVALCCVGGDDGSSGTDGRDMGRLPTEKTEVVEEIAVLTAETNASANTDTIVVMDSTIDGTDDHDRRLFGGCRRD